MCLKSVTSGKLDITDINYHSQLFHIYKYNVYKIEHVY